MPKDYKHIKPNKKKSSTNKNHLKSFSAGLIVGLFFSVIGYFYQQNRIHQTKFIRSEMIVEKPSPEIKQNKGTPPPTFDFYQILPNMEVNFSEWEAKDDEKTEQKNEEKNVYILQIGSFRQYEAADEVKAKLALMGITADIQRVVINGKDIRHRVRIGPYTGSEKLSVVRQQLVKNNLKYMLLELKGRK